MTQVFHFLLQWGPHGPHEPQGPHGPMGPGWGGGGAMPWGPGPTGGTAGLGPLPWLLALLALLALAVGVYLLVRNVAGRPDEGADALGVLERRYARGDVDEEEFAARRARLVEDP